MIIYPYSIQPGGLTEQHGHAQFRQSHTAYVNYRFAGQVYWTGALQLRAHEDVSVSHDGNLLRFRCGNTISYVPMKPRLPIELERLVVPAMEVPASETPETENGANAHVTNAGDYVSAPEAKVSNYTPLKNSVFDVAPVAGLFGSIAPLNGGFIAPGGGVPIAPVVPVYPLVAPEPSSVGLWALGVGFLFALGKRMKRG